MVKFLQPSDSMAIKSKEPHSEGLGPCKDDLSRRLTGLLLICAGLLHPPASAEAANGCNEFFAGRHGLSMSETGWGTLPNAAIAPVPARLLIAFRNEILAADLGNAFDIGNRLNFAISTYAPDYESGREPIQYGEQIQAIFLKRLIAATFPDATFFSPAAPGQKSVAIHVTDSAVLWADGSQTRHRIRQIEMADLKAANPGPEAVARTKLRSLMGLPPGSVVASIYASYRTDPIQAFAMAEKVLDAGFADVAIVSHPLAAELDGVRADRSAEVGGIRERHFIRASTIERGSLLPGRRYVVVNDLKGRMPSIHGAADYAVVLGAANVFEPLNAGTPTLFMADGEANYDRARWQEIATAATATGGAYGVADQGAALALLAGGMLKGPVRSVGLLSDAAGATPLARVARRVAEAIRDGTR